MSRNNISTPFGFHDIAGIVEITATTAGAIKRGEKIVIGKMPTGATLEDIIGVCLKTDHGYVQGIGGRMSGGSQHITCIGMSPEGDDLLILENVEVRFWLDGDNIQLEVWDYHGFTNKGVAYAHPENGEALFGNRSQIVKIYIK